LPAIDGSLSVEATYSEAARCSLFVFENTDMKKSANPAKFCSPVACCWAAGFQRQHRKAARRIAQPRPSRLRLADAAGVWAALLPGRSSIRMKETILRGRRHRCPLAGFHFRKAK
jgi:hypothetical protein